MRIRSTILYFFLGATLSLLISAAFLFKGHGTMSAFLDSANVMEYVGPAENMVRFGVYSADSEPPLSPSRFRPPLYPAMLAGLFALGGRPAYLAILVLNACAFGMSVVLLHRLASRFLPSRWAHAGALLFALDPLSLRYSASLLADTIATFLILLILLVMLSLWKYPTWGRAAGTGALIAMGVYIRPNLLFLIVPAVLIILWRQTGWRRIGVALVGALVLVGAMLPWQIRNMRTFGNAHFASLDWQYLYYVAVPYVLGNHEDKPWREVRKDLQAAMREKYPFGARVSGELVENYAFAPVGSFLVQESFGAIRKYPAVILRTALAGYARFFFDDGAHELAYAIAPSPAQSRGIHILIGEGRFLEAAKDLVRRSPWFVTAFTFGKILWATLYLGVILGVIRIVQRRAPRSYGMLLVVLLVFLIAAATLALPVSESRHRMLYQPLLYLFGLTGWAAWESARKPKTTPNPLRKGV